MIEMKITPDPTNPDLNILELRIKAPASPEPTPIPVEKIPTLIYIDDDIEEAQLPNITHALTDTVNRMTWAEQIQLASSKHRLPNHLESQNLQKVALFTYAASLGNCALILLTNDESKELRKEISKASEFLTKVQAVQPTTTIELIDNLNDHIQDLKNKTMVNVALEIELPMETGTIEALDYIPTLTKQGNKYFVNLIDLASEEERTYSAKLRNLGAAVNFSYEDLVLGRRIQGGQRLYNFVV